MISDKAVLRGRLPQADVLLNNKQCLEPFFISISARRFRRNLHLGKHFENALGVAGVVVHATDANSQLSGSFVWPKLKAPLKPETRRSLSSPGSLQPGPDC